VTQPAGQTELFGRTREVARVAASRAPLTLLTGDSGVGKSDVLTAAQAETPDAIAPDPRSLPSSGGALQRLLLEGLAAALATDAAARGSGGELAGRLAGAAERVVAQGGQGLVRLIGQEVLALVRGQLGENVGEGLIAYAAALKEPADERLAVRLYNAIDRGAAELVLSFAAELLLSLENQSVVLAFDAGERLAPEDVRVLSDLAEGLPDGMRIRIAVSTYADGRQDIVDELRTVGVSVAEIELEGIAEDGIREWLDAEDLTDVDVAQLRRATGGYALYVGDLIAYLKDGGAIEQAPLHEQLARRTEEAWHGLSTEVAGRARRLCVFADPLEGERTASLLGLSASEWAETQERLQRARIFSIEVNGRPWFHEQRRRYLLEQKLTTEERAAACVDGVAVVSAIAQETGRTDRLTELAELLPQASTLLEENEQLRAVVALDEPQLALCAAFVELMEPAMGDAPMIDAQALLRHARRVFEISDDLIVALRQIGEGPLVQLLEQQQGAIARSLLGEQLVVFAIIGRARRSLPCAPIPGAAGAVFETVIRPRVEPFLATGYGIGDPRMAGLGAESVDLRRRLGALALVDGRDTGPNLLLRGHYGGRPFYAHLSFEEDSQREQAYNELHELTTEVLDQPFDVSDLLLHPSQAVPARRFLLAAGRLLGGELNLSFDGTRASRKLAATQSMEGRLETRAAIIRLVRERADVLERYAMDIDKPIGFLFHDDGKFSHIAEVIGGREDAKPAAGPARHSFNEPFWAYMIEELDSLTPQERVAIVKFSMGGADRDSDPAIEAFADLAKMAAHFNGVQQRVQIELNDPGLAAQIEQALNLRLDDAQALHESGLFGEDIDPPAPAAYDIRLMQESAAEGPFMRAGEVIARSSVGERDRVTVTVADSMTRMSEVMSQDTISWTQGRAHDLIANLLGHRVDDVRLRY
jgi:hypothetical protein